jgi:hypothetical protein
MQTATGRITIVQEQRFRLVTASGQGLMLTLAHNASVGAGDLSYFRDSQTPVVVAYEGQPGMSSGVAHTIRPSNGQSLTG